jgi:hypothetical protein
MPVTVEAEWRSTPVTTDPPRQAEHLEWEAAFRLSAPVDVRVVALLTHGGETHWGLQPDEPARELELRARFSPWRWRTSEAVAIQFAGRSVRVTDAVLKRDAREASTTVAPGQTQTREITELLQLPAHAITLAFIAFALDDTEGRPLGRWRIAPAATAQLAERLAPLASGYQSGTLIA